MTPNDERREEIKKRLAELDKDIPVEMIARLHTKEEERVIAEADATIVIAHTRNPEKPDYLVVQIGKQRERLSLEKHYQVTFERNNKGILDDADEQGGQQ